MAGQNKFRQQQYIKWEADTKKKKTKHTEQTRGKSGKKIMFPGVETEICYNCSHK